MSSTSSAPATYARPMPSWPGERSTWPSASGERTVNVGPPAPLVEASSAPSQKRTVNGRSGSASASASRSGSVLTPGPSWPPGARARCARRPTPGRISPARGSPTPEGSNCQARRPWACDVGNAWWLLCHASPKVKNDSQKRLRDSSFVWNACRPKKWHSELIEYVTWCRTSSRTAPPHSRPVSPVVIVPPMAMPSRNGATRARRPPRARTSGRPSGRPDRRAGRARSASGGRGGCAGTASRRARGRGPRSAPRSPEPWSTCGLWGSPGRSENAWCLRWSATQEMTGPSIAIEPRPANTPRTTGAGLERPVGEQPVEADRDAEPGGDVHDHEDDHVAPARAASPQLPGDDPEAEEGHDGHRAGEEAVERLVRAWLDVVDERSRGSVVAVMAREAIGLRAMGRSWLPATVIAERQSAVREVPVLMALR